VTLLVVPLFWGKSRRNRLLVALWRRAGWEIQVLDVGTYQGAEIGVVTFDEATSSSA